MNKSCFIFIIIPLVIVSQEVFAASYNQGHGTYSTQTPGSIQNNNIRLRKEVCEYNQELNKKLEVLQRTPKFNCDKSTSPVPWGNQETQKQNIQQHETTSPSDNSLQLHRETPNWWRQEGSYQGWGFD